MEEKQASESKIAEVVNCVYKMIKEPKGVDYVVLKGCTSQIRESVVKGLIGLVNFPVYTESQFPNNGRKIDIDLAPYF